MKSKLLILSIISILTWGCKKNNPLKNIENNVHSIGSTLKIYTDPKIVPGDFSWGNSDHTVINCASSEKVCVVILCPGINFTEPDSLFINESQRTDGSTSFYALVDSVGFGESNGTTFVRPFYH